MPLNFVTGRVADPDMTTLVVVRDGRIIHARGYGLANAELRTPADVHTVWPLASITKLVTAIAAMQLVESGDLSLHQDINTYFKRLRVPDKYDSPITLGDLLRHTSGLDELPGRRVARAEDIEPFHEFMSDHLVQYRAPGTFTSYSSYGMALAGLLVEEVTGLSYAEYVASAVSSSMNMGRLLLAVTGTGPKVLSELSLRASD